MQTGAEDIYFLEDVGFDTFARDQDEMLVMFYSNSCGACSRIKPFYEEVATLMVEERPELTLAAVDLSKARGFSLVQSSHLIGWKDRLMKTIERVVNLETVMK